MRLYGRADGVVDSGHHMAAPTNAVWVLCWNDAAGFSKRRCLLSRVDLFTYTGEKIVSEMTYSASSGTLNLESILRKKDQYILESETRSLGSQRSRGVFRVREIVPLQMLSLIHI